MADVILVLLRLRSQWLHNDRLQSDCPDNSLAVQLFSDNRRSLNTSLRNIIHPSKLPRDQHPQALQFESLPSNRCFSITLWLLAAINHNRKHRSIRMGGICWERYLCFRSSVLWKLLQ